MEGKDKNPKYSKVTQSTLDDFVVTLDKSPNLTDKELLSKFPEFGNDINALNSAFDYVATIKGKDYSQQELYSKFPEFNLGGVEPPKKKEATVSPSTSGGGKQGYLSNALSSQFGAIPTVDEQPVTQPSNEKPKEGVFAQIPKSYGTGQRKQIDITKAEVKELPKEAEDILGSYNTSKSVVNQYKDAKSELDNFLQTGGDAEGNRLMGFDPSTGQILPDSPADKYKKQLEANVDSLGKSAQSAIKDFEKTVPSAKKLNIALGMPKEMQGVSPEQVLDTPVAKALDKVQEYKDTQDYYKGMGISLNDAYNKAADLSADVFLDNNDRVLYDAYRTGDEVKIKEALEYRNRGVQSQIDEIKQDMVLNGYDPDKAEQIKRLQQSISDVLSISPEAALKQVDQNNDAANITSVAFKNLNPLERARLEYLSSFKQANELAQKYVGGPIFVKDQSGRTVLNNNVNIWANGVNQLERAGESEDKKKVLTLIDNMKLLAPVTLLNKPSVKSGDSFVESAGKEVATLFRPDAIGLKTPAEQNVRINEFLSNANVDTKSLSPEFKNLVDWTSKPSWSETTGSAAGYLIKLIPELYLGGELLETGKFIAEGLPLAKKVLQGGEYLSKLLGKAPSVIQKGAKVAGEAAKIGAQSEIAGRLFNDESLSFAPMAGEALGGEAIELATRAFGKTPIAVAIFKSMEKVFGDSTTKFVNTLIKANSYGTAELVGENVGNAIQIWQESPTYKDFVDNLQLQYGDFDSNLKNFVLMYSMGAAFGGYFGVDANKFLSDKTKKAYDALGEISKEAADDMLSKDKEANNKATAETVDEVVKDLPTETVVKQAEDMAKAKEELDKVAEGEQYKVTVGDITFEGNSAEELQNDKDQAERLFNTYTNEQTEREAGKTETPAVQQPTGEDVGVGVTEEVVGKNKQVEIGQSTAEINERIADIERRRKENLDTTHTANNAVIAADYLFTGGRDVMLSTDYLLQALVGSFPYAAKQIDLIRKKYASQIGNIRDDVNTEVYNKMMSEIKDVINKSYNNNSDINNIFNKILENPTGFTYREGSAISRDLDKLNEIHEQSINDRYDAELAALENKQVGGNSSNTKNSEQAHLTQQTGLNEQPFSKSGQQFTETISEKQVSPTENVKVDETKAEVISDTDYTDFVDNGTVKPEIIQSIADKIKTGEALTVRENAIFTDKTADVNSVLQSEPTAQPKTTEQVNPSLFSSSAATREKALRDVSPEMKEKVRKVNEVLSKENIPALVKAMENNPELFEKKYGLVKIC